MDASTIELESPPSTRCRSRIFWGVCGELLAILLLAFLATAQGWLPGREFIPTEIVHSIEPWGTGQSLNDPRVQSLQDDIWTQYAVDQLRQREIPLWDPHVQTGIPLIATGAVSLFFPTTLLLLLLRPSLSWVLAAWLKLITAGIGTWLLARRYGASAPGRIMAAMSFMLCGLILWSAADSCASVAAMLPWVILVTERTLERPAPGRIALGGVVLGLAVLGADPGAIAGTMLAMLAVAAWRIARGSRRVTTTGALLAMTAVGLLVAGVQIIPTIEYVVNLPLISGAQYAPWWRLPVVARLVRVNWSTPPFLTGVAALAATATLLCHRKKYLPLLLSILLLPAFAILILLKISPAPIATFLTTIGLLAGPSLALSILAGAGIDTLPPLSARLANRSIAILSGIAAITAILGIFIRLNHPWILHVGICLGFAALALWLLAYLPDQHPKISPGWALLILAAIEILLPAIPYGIASKLVALQPRSNSALARLAQDPAVGRIDAPGDILPPPLATAIDVEDVRGYPALPTSIAEALLASANPPRESVSRLLNVRYWITHRDAQSNDRWLRSDMSDDQTQVFEATGIRQPVWVASSAQMLGSRDDVLKKVEGSDFEIGDKILIDANVDNPFDVPLLPLGLPGAGPWYERGAAKGAVDEAHLVMMSPKKIEIAIEPHGGGWLVLADRFYPGWQAEAYLARVDYSRPSARPTVLPIVPAYGCLRTVLLPPRADKIIFEYDPLSFRWGCFASAAGAILILLLCGFTLGGRYSV